MLPTLPERWIPRALLLVGVAATVGVSGCEKAASSNPVKAVQASAAAAKEVAVVEARLESWPETIRVQGSLLAYEDAVVGSKLAGRVAEVAVDLGSIVKRGEPLVTLVRDELDLRVAAGRSAAPAGLRGDRHHAGRRREPVRCPEVARRDDGAGAGQRGAEQRQSRPAAGGVAGHDARANTTRWWPS